MGVPAENNTVQRLEGWLVVLSHHLCTSRAWMSNICRNIAFSASSLPTRLNRTRQREQCAR